MGLKPGFMEFFMEISAYAKSRWNAAMKVNQLRPGVFLFYFESEHSKKDVLERKWTLRCWPLILKTWTPEFDSDHLDLSRVLVWIQLPKLHLSLWNLVALCKMLSVIGNPLATDKLTSIKGRMAYAQVLVEVPIKDKVPVFVAVRLEDGRLIEQELIFEWIPVRCTRCKGLGHVPKNCSLPLQTLWVTKLGQPQQQIDPVNHEKELLKWNEQCDKGSGIIGASLSISHIKAKEVPHKSDKERNSNQTKVDVVIVMKDTISDQKSSMSTNQPARRDGMVTTAEGMDVI